jgi:hypothetical protein
MEHRRTSRILYPALVDARERLTLTNREIAALLDVELDWWRGLLCGRCVASPEVTDRIEQRLGVERENFPHVHRPEHRPAVVAQ